jgi:hypothetical protein
MDEDGNSGDQPGDGQDVPADDAEAKRKGEQNRKQMDEIPAHGTDPLHEGP